MSDQAGFTLIEVLVSTLMLTTGLATGVTALTSGNNANNVVQRKQTAIQVAQRELEKLSNVSYDELALSSQPQTSADQNTPPSRVAGTQYQVENGQYEDLVVDTADGEVATGPTAVSDGNVEAQVYLYVTWVDAPYSGCSQDCTHDYKRVTVAVMSTSPTNKNFAKYVTVSSLRIDPNQGPNGEVNQPVDPNPTQSHDNFYLTDTPASSCTTNTYQSPSASHAVHDTLGHCASSNSDYPDLMRPVAPPNPSDPDTPPYRTYSTDLSGNYSDGLAVQRGTDCTLTGLTKFQKHSWTTDPVSTSAYELTGSTSFDFWSATVGGTAGLGKVCVWLYDRNMVSGSPQDTLIGSSSDQLTNWPATPTNLSFTFSHNSYTLAAGRRLHFVLTVSSTSATDLFFRYDHPAAPSFVQVRTTTPVT